MTIHARIEHHARKQPDAPAVIVEGRTISYQDFWSSIRSAAAYIAGSRIAPGSIVALVFDSNYDAFVGVLACQLAGHPVAVVKPAALRGLKRLEIARLYTDQAAVAATGSEREHLRDGWPEGGGPGFPSGPDCPIAADALAQLFFTSGTTGRPKMIPHTRQQLEYHIEQNLAGYRGHARQSHLSLSPPAHPQGIARAFAQWHIGWTVILEQRMHPAEAIVQYEPDSVHVFPMLLSRILERWPEGWRPRDRVRIRVGGSRLPPAVHAAARRVPGIEIEGSYGTSETFTIGLIEPVPPGAPWPDDYAVLPGVDLEAVDASDHPLPPGQSGALRIRSPAMAVAYVDDPEASAKYFRGGWFYPGDVALVAPSGRFRIVGRDSELLDLGGIKIAAEQLDAKVCSVQGIRDAAAFALPGAAGLDELWIAVVWAPGASKSAASRAIRRKLRGIVRLYIIEYAEIPRNENGKIARRELADSVSAARARHTP